MKVTMINSKNDRQISAARTIVLIIVLVSLSNTLCTAQIKPEKFWLAGRYDGNRVIVYFDAVQFNHSVPSEAKDIANPVVYGFFTPMELPANYIAQFLKKSDAESFALGDKYDLIMDEGHIATVTLTQLVGTEGDEAVGNDSYIGALATVGDHDLIFLSNTIYAIRRHRETPNAGVRSILGPGKIHPGLEKEPVRFDIQTKIVALLTQRMKTTTEVDQSELEHVSPVFEVQSFHLADGKLRYYAQAAWNTGTGTQLKTVYALAAWIAPLPTLHILAVETRTSPYNGVGITPSLVNVIDLGKGRTGIVVTISGEDSGSTDLVEYRDGTDWRQMLGLQSISAGE